MDLRNQRFASGRPSGRSFFVHPSVLLGKNFRAGHYVQIFPPNSVMAVLFVGTFDCFCLLLLLVTLTSAGKLAFQLIKMEFCAMIKQFQLNIPMLLFE